MSEVRSASSVMSTVKCPACKRDVTPQAALDGVNRPRTDLFYYPEHSGNRWGRTCKMSREVVQ